MLTNKSRVAKLSFYCLVLTAFCLLATSCRYDMEDQPRYRVYKPSTWHTKDGTQGRSWGNLPEGTVSRGNLRENTALYTGKLENSTGTAQTNDAGQQITFPDSVTEIPIPVDKETLDRGEKQYKIYCSICHGDFGNGDGMIVRRGFPQPPSYNDDRLRNAPVGHFFDVSSNGWGKMSGYSSQVSVSDRWAIVAYIKALQLSQNPNKLGTTATPAVKPGVTTTPTAANTSSNANNAVTNTNISTNANANVNNSGGAN